MVYSLASPGIFRTIQGEGALLGTPMVFVRLAGCSVGCPQCDTDYRVGSRLSVDSIQKQIDDIRGNIAWYFVTGGEPADHDLWPLCEMLRLNGKIALVTSGTRSLRTAGRLIDFLAVSPHGKPENQVLLGGSQINLVPGLNGLSLADWDDYDATGFSHRFVTPLAQGDNLNQCLAFIDRHPSWRLGVQAHKVWGLP